ncbi:MAG TPA: alpha/beta hydrolase-fold protein [Gemmatimonadaceae bacterium]|nr:alpha/beta hydrolase-fold protein [Gemmatimonadaceae bacterium]
MRTRSILTSLCALTGVAALTATKPLARHEPGVGTVKEFRFKSKIYERTRRVWVYTPPNYPDACGDVCPLIVAFDGEEYLSDIPLPGILDSLTAAKRIPPSVALLIDDGDAAERLADLANQPKFVTYVADELMPWLHSRWRVTRDPARTIVTGSSAGGLAAAYLAFQKPDLFGNVLSQSGAFWRGNAGSNDAPYEWLADQYKAAARKPIRFFLDVGAMETGGAVGGAAPSILTTNQHLRDVLREKGYAVEYFEVPNGVHAPETWKPRLPVGLSALAATP